MRTAITKDGSIFSGVARQTRPQQRCPKRSKSLPRFISFAKNPNQPILGAAGQPSDPIQRPTILYLVFGHLKEIIFLNGILLAHGYTIVNFSLLTWKKVNLNSKIYKRYLLELPCSPGYALTIKLLKPSYIESKNKNPCIFNAIEKNFIKYLFWKLSIVVFKYF